MPDTSKRPGTSKKRMTARGAALGAAVLAWSVVVLAQAVNSRDELSRAMKTIGTAMESVAQAAEARSFNDAKTPLALTRQTLASTRPWWVGQQEAEAVQMTRASVAALDALDKVLSAASVDPAAVTTTIGEVNRSCDACHARYRAGDPQSGYRIRADGKAK